jgi:hypothetical protein
METSAVGPSHPALRPQLDFARLPLGLGVLRPGAERKV